MASTARGHLLAQGRDLAGTAAKARRLVRRIADTTPVSAVVL